VVSELAIFTGNGQRQFAEAVCRHLEMPLGEVEVFEFSNENIFVRYLDNMRERDVFLVHVLKHGQTLGFRLTELKGFVSAKVAAKRFPLDLANALLDHKRAELETRIA